MKQLKQLFKQILEIKCLTKGEKIYLRKTFKDFVDRRKIIERNSVQFIDESDFWPETQFDGNCQRGYFSNFD